MKRGRDVIGFLPAAGRGRRFGGDAPKELAPLDPAGEVPVCRVALAAMREAGARRAVVVVSPDKAAIRRQLGAGAALGLELTYVVQIEPRGLPDAVRCARPVLGDDDVLFAMPDTVFGPPDALGRVHRALQVTAAELVLGLFPTDTPTELAPVELDPAGRVSAIHDKPAITTLRNTWGVLAWSRRFSDLCCRFEADREGEAEGTLSAAMEQARALGLAVAGHELAGGFFCDAGTPSGLARARALWLAGRTIGPRTALAAQAG